MLRAYDWWESFFSIGCWRWSSIPWTTPDHLAFTVCTYVCVSVCVCFCLLQGADVWMQRLTLWSVNSRFMMCLHILVTSPLNYCIQTIHTCGCTLLCTACTACTACATCATLIARSSCNGCKSAHKFKLSAWTCWRHVIFTLEKWCRKSMIRSWRPPFECY